MASAVVVLKHETSTIRQNKIQIRRPIYTFQSTGYATESNEKIEGVVVARAKIMILTPPEQA